MHRCEFQETCIAMSKLNCREPVIVKRINDLENEIKQEISDVTTHIPRFYGDRFIPRRYMARTLSTSYNSDLNAQKKNIDFVKMREIDGYWRTKTYTNVLKCVLAIKQDRIYKLSDPIVKNTIEIFFNISPKMSKIQRAYPNMEGYDWPCNPRSKPLACSDSTHDLPGFSANLSYNIMSWSARGHIAASFKTDLVLWTPYTHNTLVYKFKGSRAIAYDPAGCVLAVSCRKTNQIALQLWDVREENIIHYIKEYKSTNLSDEICCMDWDATGKILACGTKRGTIDIFQTDKMKKIRTLEQSLGEIFSVKFSPKMNYFAANDIGGNTCIWRWDSCHFHTKLAAKRHFKTYLDWHPWNGVDLVVTEGYPAGIMIFNVPSKTIVARYKRRDGLIEISAAVFNKRSAELLVSCAIKNSDGSITSEILVMASLDRIVDVLKSHDDIVRYLTWSPDGVQLATAGDDDTLTIWNFFALKCISLGKVMPKKQLKNEERFNLYRHIR